MLFRRFAKKVAAVILAAVAVSCMLSTLAFADDYLAVTGSVTEIGSNYICVNVHDREVPFFVTSATEFNYDFVSVDDVVQVVFAGSQPDIALQVITVGVANAPRIDHSHYSVTGIITDATMNTITVMSKGKYRTFGKEDAQLEGVYDGLLLGDTVEITYSRGNQQEAQRITMISQGENHRRSHPQEHTHYAVTGTVTDATMNTITVLSTSGKYRTFGKADNTRIVGARDGVALGDVVKIVYAKSDPQIAVQLTMVKRGDNH